MLLCISTVSFSQVRIDLAEARVYTAVNDPKVLLGTRTVLVEEVQKRSGITLPQTYSLDPGKGSYIVLALEKDVPALPEAFQKGAASTIALEAEGFRLIANSGQQSVVIVGKDARGLLYGVGRFLRKAEMRTARIRFSEEDTISTSPRFPLRGHQLGYRPKTNSYDAFTVKQFDQYIRELALFGANSIEIMPPRTDDDLTSKHMKLPALKMMTEQARICRDYGLDVWMWYPNLAKDYTDPATVKAELDEREEVFRSLPKLDAVFVPGGDPGDLEPDALFAWMDQVAVVLKRHHPEAKLWVSPQSFRPENSWFDAFFVHANKGYPWLGGIVFGPWVKVPIETIREKLNPAIPIRNYPDITHSIACQYPVADWDPAWALALGREAVNPRPYDQKIFHNAVAPFCVGSLSYSEGTNDDVNKFIWSDQDWDPETDVMETLRDYVRLFFGAEWAQHGALALAALEKNHVGPLLGNTSVERTLWKWQYMEKYGQPELHQNARFQMGLIRAYFDAYTRERLVYETQLEQRAREELHQATRGNTGLHIGQSKAFLEQTWKNPVRLEWRQKCLELADSLFKSIGAQLTVDKHGAMPGRGNFIDNLQFPLTEVPWLLKEIGDIERLRTDAERIPAIQKLLARTDPGPGGFYDHLGSPDSWYRVVRDLSWKQDPGSLQSPRIGYGMNLPGKEMYRDIPGAAYKIPLVPRNWFSQMETLYDVPLKVQYDQLDPRARYRIRIAYTGRFKAHLKLTTDDGSVIHDYLKTGDESIYEFDVPREVTSDGKAVFSWNCKEGERGVQVSEIWLIRAPR